MSDRATAIKWARRVLDDPLTVFFDVETTGLGDDAEIVEVGIVASNGCAGWGALVRPTAAIPAEATAVNGIDDAMVADAPTWAEVWRGDDWEHGVADRIAGRRIVAWNAAFDRRMVEASCRRLGLALPVAAWECAMRAFSAYVGAPDGRRGRLKRHRLGEAARLVGVEPGGHRALADATTCRAIVAAMAVEGRREE